MFTFSFLLQLGVLIQQAFRLRANIIVPKKRHLH